MTADVAVIVPVMLRPANAAPFMASLRASTDSARVYAMADAGDIDTKNAWRAAGADEVWTGTHKTFAKKANEGFRVSSEPWLFPVGDDVRFHPGWLEAALTAAGGHHVVGTNDLHNPRVISGDHATHLLIRRSYVERVGASWDGPGMLCHPGYGHWYVDDEIVAVAKQRGVWTMALDSRVEHRHPLYGHAPMDWVYELGQSHRWRDEALFCRRVRAHASEVARAR